MAESDSAFGPGSLPLLRELAPDTTAYRRCLPSGAFERLDFGAAAPAAGAWTPVDDPSLTQALNAALRGAGPVHWSAPRRRGAGGGAPKRCFLRQVGPGEVLAQSEDFAGRSAFTWALRESEARYHTLVESLPQHIFVKDADLVYVSCNERYARTLGCPAPQYIAGRSDYDFYPRDLAEKYRDDDRRVLREGQTLDLEERFVAEGEERWVQTLKAPVRDEQGRAVGVLGAFWDITARKCAELALEQHRAELERLVEERTADLRASELKYRNLFENAQVGLFRTRAGDGRVIAANAVCAAVAGYDDLAEFLASWTASEVYEDPAARSRLLDLLRREGQVRDFETRLRCKDGSSVEVSMAARLFEEEGIIEGAMVDVTRRRRAEEALASQQQRLFSLLESIPAGIFALDGREGRPVYANRRAVELLGKEADPAVAPEALAEAYRAVRAGSDDPYPSESMPIVRALHGESVSVEDMELRTLSGGRVSLLVSGSPVFAADGSVDYGIAAFFDVTEQRRAQRALSAALAEVERSNRELEQFAYVASHDLQEPLRMVSSFVQLLDQRYGHLLDGDGREFIAFAVSGAQRMKRMVDDLLALSRIGTRGRPMEPVEAQRALAEAQANLRLAMAESGAQVTCDALPALRADPVQLVRLLQNLLDNAIKYRSPALPPRISLSAEPEGTFVHFRMQDNGVGIDSRHHERIFGVFQRLVSQEELPGSGIGLSVCQRIVERHGGRIWVESAPGEGATFHFTLPGLEAEPD